MTRALFDLQMKRLIGLRFAPETLDTHWEGLSDLPDDVLAAAVGRAVRTRADFPTPIELRQDADATRRPTGNLPDRSVPLDTPVTFTATLPASDLHVTIPVDRTWNFYCEACGDSGLREYWCGARFPLMLPGLEERSCERKICRRDGGSYGHAWAEPCACLDWNPEIKRRKDRLAKYAQTAGKK